jgi:hypothetical protein
MGPCHGDRSPHQTVYRVREDPDRMATVWVADVFLNSKLETSGPELRIQSMLLVKEPVR